ncbi:unnamed protein product [Linum trigynum]|uniref:F-box domain-containing protein n=1 Tax=Linum trigynum TaxID=586398 RepID=A0AAV2FC35_9ROSI
MDPAIWSRLPEEILDHILSLLPLKTFMNLRSTCKRFDSLIFSPSFISKHSSAAGAAASPPSLLLLSHPHFPSRVGVYDAATASWRSIHLSLSSASTSPRAAATLLSSSNGLFCLRNSSSLLISNFLTKSSRPINFPTFPFDFDSLTLISTESGYSIFAHCSRSSFVYSSAAQSWSQFDGFSPALSESCRQEGVFFRGSLYFTTQEPIQIVRFDVRTGEWGSMETELPAGISFARLVSNGERKLYLVGGVGNNGISKTVKLWELDGGGDWVEIERLPEMMCRKFVSVCYHNYEHVYCFWHQGMICICCYTWPEILYYKVGRRTWHWLPKCPSLPEKWSCGFKWFSFVPQLYALV